MLLYVPFFHTFFRTILLGPLDLFICAACGWAAFVAVEILKAVRRSRVQKRQWVAKWDQIIQRRDRKLALIDSRLAKQGKMLEEALAKLHKVHTSDHREAGRFEPGP